MSNSIEPFTINVGDDVLDDLRRRLRATRWPEREPVSDWTQGVPLDYVRDVCEYWAEHYDWRSREKALNQFAQFRTTIDGLGIHFIHVRSPHADAMPLVLSHGWPGSIVEFAKCIGPLTDPTNHGGAAVDAFHVVVPALPGYGFSDKPSVTGWGVEHIADAWAELMTRLGYARFGAQGGDWGSAITTAIGAHHGDRCVGIHVNMASARPDLTKFGELLPEEHEAIAALEHYQRWDSGYSKEQSTRPQTVGYGLTDSPAGQAAWILEKFWAWTDCNGHPENALTRDEMLDNIMFYWVTASATSSARLYWESFGAFRDGTVEIPTGVAIFPKEIIKASRRWCETRYTDIRHWTIQPRGGHFAAFEQPELFVDDVRAFFRLVR